MKTLKRRLMSIWRDVVAWFYFKFLYDEQYKGKFLMGLREGIWTWMCGYDVNFSLKMARIWWFPKPRPTLHAPDAAMPPASEGFGDNTPRR